MTATQSPLLVTMPAEEFFSRLENIIETKLSERIPAQPTGEALPELMTRKEAAVYLNCSIATVDNLSRSGLLEKHYLAGLPRFRREEVRTAFQNWKKYAR